MPKKPMRIGPLKPRPAVAEEFVSGQVTKSPSVQGDKRRLTVYLERDLAKRLLVRCAEEDKALSDAVSRALELWLLRRE